MKDDVPSLNAQKEALSIYDADDIYHAIATETLLYRQLASAISAETIRFVRESVAFQKNHRRVATTTASNKLSRVVVKRQKNRYERTNDIPPDFEVARYATGCCKETQQSPSAIHNSKAYTDAPSLSSDLISKEHKQSVGMNHSFFWKIPAGICPDCGGVRDVASDQIRIRSSSTTPISRTLRRRRSRARAKAMRKYKKQQQQQKSFSRKTTTTTPEALVWKNSSTTMMEFSPMTATCKNVGIWTCRFCGATSRIPGFYYNDYDSSSRPNAIKPVSKQPQNLSFANHRPNHPTKNNNNKRKDAPKQSPKAALVTSFPSEEKNATAASARTVDMDEDFIDIPPESDLKRKQSNENRRNYTSIPTTNPKKKNNKALLDFLSSLNR